MNRRNVLKKIGVGIGLTTSLAGCGGDEETSTTTPIDTVEPETPTERRRDIARTISVAPTREDLVKHDSWTEEFREVDGEEKFVISITTRNPTESGGTLEYIYGFTFEYNVDEENQIEKQVTIPPDGEGLASGESHEWEFVLDEKVDELYHYIATVQPA